MMNISIAENDEAILATYQVMRQLRPNISEADYVARVRLQGSEVGFQLAALTADDHVVCVAGFRLCRSLGWGRFLYVDDLVTDTNARSRGFGAEMLQWLGEHARQKGCIELRLDSALHRHGAHRFYLAQRLDILCFHFSLQLGNNEDRKPETL